MPPVFSRAFIVQQGLLGDSQTITVPAGHTYVVKQLTMYSNPLLAQTSGHFRDLVSGATLFAAFFQPSSAGWQGFFGSLAFEEGQSFRWETQGSVGEPSDVYAGGYDLVNT